MLRRLLRYLALRHGIAISLYRKFGHPVGEEWADVVRAHGGLYHVGEDCMILPSTLILDPAYTWIGDRVTLGSCKLIAHDGSVRVLERAYGVKLDRVGAIKIEDDVFVGEDVIIAAGGGVTIGKGSIIGAGSVVRESVPPGSIVIGNPAKIVAKTADLVRFWEADTLALPWSDLIQQRAGSFDPAMEAELARRRQQYFFGSARD